MTMSRGRRRTLLCVAAAVAVSPVVAGAPRGRLAGTGIDTLVSQCRATGLSGWALVDDATARLHASLTHESSWHLWYTPEASVRHGQGRDTQYNLALARVLRGLGFDVRVVHAALVRGLGQPPWFQRGHLWLQVTHDGHTRDVCAGHGDNRAGHVPFVAVSEVQVARPWTPWVVAAGLAPFVVDEVWRSTRQRRSPAEWLYRPIDTDPRTR